MKKPRAPEIRKFKSIGVYTSTFDEIVRLVQKERKRRGVFVSQAVVLKELIDQFVAGQNSKEK